MAVAAASPADRELCERFARDGYVRVDDAGVLDGIDAESIWARCASAFDGGADRVQDLWTTSPAARAIATHPAILATLRALFGREPVPFQTLHFLRGSQQRTHSDTIHFASMPGGFMCGVWVALEDVTLAQGPLHYVPGSHALPAYDYDDLGIAVPGAPHDWANPQTLASYRQYEDRVERILADGGYRGEELTIRRGGYFVWAANLFHGGSPIADPARTRKSQVTHYYFAGVVPYTPMFSQRSRGAFKVREVRSAVTGRWVVPTLDGDPVLFERVAGGLRRIHPVTTPAQRLAWQLVQHRPLPDSPVSMLRDRWRSLVHGVST